MSKSVRYIKIVTYDNFPYGGAPANYLRYFSLSLALQENNKVEAILPTGNFYGNKSDLNTSRTGVVENINYQHLGYIEHPKNYVGKFLDNTCGYFLPIAYFIKERIKNRVDVIIIYNTTFTNTLLFLLIKRIIGKKLIIILPEYYEKPAKTYSLARLKWLNFYFGMNYLVQYADKFVVLSDFLKNYLISKNIRKENILILPNITDPELFKVHNATEHIQGKITIGYSGTPTKKDGVDDLIKSFAALTKKYTNIHLLIIGDAVSSNTVIPRLRNLVESLDIADKVTFTGLVSFKDVPLLLNSCQILALTRPSGVFAEAGFPTKLGEYFACMKPVLVTSVGDIKKHFVNGVHAVIAEPENIDSIVEGFESLILNEQLRQQLAVNAYKWLQDNLNFTTLSIKIDNFCI